MTAPPHRHPLVAFCWLQVGLAAVLVSLMFANVVTRPWMGFEYSRVDGRVQDVVEGSPADRAGMRVGDRVLSIAGHRVGPGVIPLFFERAGEPVAVITANEGVLQVTPIPFEEMRRLGLRGNVARVLQSLHSYLTFPLHLWMLALGATLLRLRGPSKDARLAALVMIYWAGGVFFYPAAGVGAMLASWPPSLRLAIYLIDAAFIAAFFAACVHFAIVFPTDYTQKQPRAWGLVPWIVAVPIFLEAASAGILRANGSVARARTIISDPYSTIGTVMLLSALAILAFRFVRISEVNPRRRIKLVFLSMLPGVVTFTSGYLVNLLQLGHTASLTVRMLHTPATILGSAIFAYAVVRHRMFNIRVLVRRSIQYALARGTLLVLLSLPVIGLVVYLYAHRRDSLAVLLTGQPAVYLVLLVPLVLAVRYRKTLLEALDRKFFREQYDARQLLLHVVSIIRGGSDMLILSRAAIEEIDKALHPVHISLWHLDPDGAELHRGFVRGQNTPHEAHPLPTSSMLATLLANDDEPLDVHSRLTRSVLGRLPEHDREWLRQARAALLVPLLIEKRLAGLMVLGERMSEEPYSREDRELLRTLAAQLALTLDYSRLKQSPSLVWSPPTHTPVHTFVNDALRLCPACGRCYPQEQPRCDYDGQPLVPESGVPRIIEEKYVVTKLLGRGGMGSVYLATQKRLNRPVAVKVLLAHLVGSSSMRTRFEREARIVARLRHPAIVTIHDFGVLPSGHAYLVMEYLDGETLRKTIVEGPRTMEAALEILRPVGDAIDAAHRVGVVHRDLKPENIMIVRERDSPALEPRVLDFGLAKMTGPIGDDEATVVQSGHSAGVVGTLMYMAPEVLSGKHADARSDQYSLALIVYELLSGEHPLGTATDLASVVRGHTEETFVSIRQRAPHVPERAAEAIHRALEKDAANRFETVADFIAALR
ncbi:MAG TPA: protein kinase [Thermoanaerobaculia bacterium]|jgi:predicted Ser/Thr protein kinase